MVASYFLHTLRDLVRPTGNRPVPAAMGLGLAAAGSLSTQCGVEGHTANPPVLAGHLSLHFSPFIGIQLMYAFKVFSLTTWDMWVYPRSPPQSQGSGTSATDQDLFSPLSFPPPFSTSLSPELALLGDT